ncbi:hypothetical protein EYF80_045992 [Liparis tanakae]|uniref:Uncharacterized protein n=1 Tax=Liparis tanakae TaxID=230148 RepID=A0A4Z2FRG1_9TELE|nr:hypothetical protein EYF80_045992 [Liparis tanakae]
MYSRRDGSYDSEPETARRGRSPGLFDLCPGLVCIATNANAFTLKTSETLLPSGGRREAVTHEEEEEEEEQEEQEEEEEEEEELLGLSDILQLSAGRKELCSSPETPGRSQPVAEGAVQSCECHGVGPQHFKRGGTLAPSIDAPPLYMMYGGELRADVAGLLFLLLGLLVLLPSLLLLLLLPALILAHQLLHHQALGADDLGHAASGRVQHAVGAGLEQQHTGQVQHQGRVLRLLQLLGESLAVADDVRTVPLVLLLHGLQQEARVPPAVVEAAEQAAAARVVLVEHGTCDGNRGDARSRSDPAFW